MKTILTVVILAVQIATHAQFFISFDGTTPVSTGPGTAAAELQTTLPQTIQSLGVWDSDLTSPGLYNSHQVGLWDVTTRQLIASATVPAQGASFFNGFWYVTIPAVTIPAGRTLALGVFYADNDFDLVPANGTAAVTAPGIVLGNARLSSGVNFEFPDISIPGANFGFFAGNAGFAPAPEPTATAAAVGLLLVAFAALRRRGALAAVLLPVFMVTAYAGPPAVSIRSILDANPAQRHRLVATYIVQHPRSKKALDPLTEPAENRPEVTPGNEHKQRPTVPPGIQNYAKP